MTSWPPGFLRVNGHSDSPVPPSRPEQLGSPLDLRYFLLKFTHFFLQVG